MKMFVLENCPHCRHARQWIEELCEENPKYRQIPLEIIDEAVDVELADSYDYYYVPSIFDGNQKCHEGVATKQKIKDIFENYMKEH